MFNLYSPNSKKKLRNENLSTEEKLSVQYHDIFDYPLDFSELIRWRVGKRGLRYFKSVPNVTSKNGYFFIQGKEGLVYKKTLSKRISERKVYLAQKVTSVLKLIPGIKMVGITGSLAMGNSREDSDIDLIIITKSGQLWTTRLISYVVTGLLSMKTRKPGIKKQKDLLCLNIWMDESNLEWGRKDRNIYTAHEIAQIVPLINKNETFEKLLTANKWILNYWPSSVVISNHQSINGNVSKTGVIEKLAYKIQYLHMKPKITREVVTPTRALFHPQDWGRVVLERLAS